METVAIVGGGASGTLTAYHLLRSDADLEVLLYESGGTAGRGIAYSTTDPRHLLNVRAIGMSALPDEPNHLVEWAESTGRPITPSTFLPRRDFAAYLDSLLAEVADRLTVVPERVVDLVRGPAGGWRVRSGADAAGGAVERAADHVVLAHGNAAPRPLVDGGGEPLPDAPWHLADPWRLEALAALPDDAVVVVVGSGLTAVDTAITALDGAPARRVVMISRSGLLPHSHVVETGTSWVTSVPAGPLRADDVADLVRTQVAAAARHDVDWRSVVDGLRGATQSIWRRLDLDERRRFLTRHARDWETHRHRMAPEVGARIDVFRAEGRLDLVGGGLGEVVDEGDLARVAVPGTDGVRAHAVVNCTGPLTDVTRLGDPLLDRLIERRTIAPDPLRLGISTTAEGAVLDADGNLVPGLFTVGPPRKGTLYESTAVPEIRVQAAALAAHLQAGGAVCGGAA